MPPTTSRRTSASQIIPTTLFGQKFISFVRPDNPSKEALHDGQVIPSDRVETNVELSKILADLFPLLRAVEPAQLNYTLNALATALQGRGEQLGQTLDELDAYLGAISDKLPTLRQDLIALANVADIYDLAAPDLIERARQPHGDQQDDHREGRRPRRVLLRPAGPGRHLDPGAVGQRAQPDPGRQGHRAGAQAARDLLPGVPLPAQGRRQVRAACWPSTFGGNQVKQFLEFGTAQYEPYHADDRPVYGEVGHGPWCSGLPNPDDPDRTRGVQGRAPTSTRTRRRPARPRTGAGSGRGHRNASGYAGTEAEKAIVNALLAGETGRAADSYGALGSLLYGPVVRGGDAS